MDAISGQLERCVVETSQLLGDEVMVVWLRMPCPSCGSRLSYRRSSGGEPVRSDALRVSEDGCDCLVCRATWSPDQFPWLARLLGCEELPA
ncbi:MAG: hypothetical protein K0U78_14045 [Actinomycetia bacterium]|nr:hypothetical protein [Actinomycetes bacterium]